MADPSIAAVFPDWAGTTVDHGSIAPVRALEDVFTRYGATVPRPLVRRSMGMARGMARKDHIRHLLAEPAVAASWAAAHHQTPGEADVDAMYARFEAQMMETLAAHAPVIPGVRPMVDCLEGLASRQGYRTDRSLAPEDVGGGRPYPWICYHLALELHICPFSACAKTGDTESDLAEGRNAGMWTVGVTRSANSMGLVEAEWAALDVDEQCGRLGVADQELRAAGANYTVDTVAGVAPVLAEIEARIAIGERP